MKLLNMLEKHIMESRENKAKVSHYPSEATACKRKLWYKWNNYTATNPPEVAAILRMEMGNAIHNYLAGKFVDMGLAVLTEVPFRADVEGLKHQISGRADNVIIEVDKVNGKRHGVEIKTTYGRGVRELREKNMPKEDAIAQIVIYFEFLHLDTFNIIYMGRDDAYRTEFIFEKREDGIYYDNEKLSLTFEDIRAKLEEVERNIDGKCPARDFKAAIKDGEIKIKFDFKKIQYKTDWQCGWCDYKDLCWKDIVEQSKDKKFYGKKEIV